MYGLAKIARSWQAKQRRLYERMLKSLHGGTEGYMEHVRQSGNRKWPEIFHGSSNDSIQKIINSGVDSSIKKKQIYGPGIYFGDKETAMKYAVNPTGNGFGSLAKIITPSEMTKLKNKNISYPQKNNVLAIDFENASPNFSDYDISKYLPKNLFPIGEKTVVNNALKYYGTIGGKNIFEHAEVGAGKQFHISPGVSLPPELFKGYNVKREIEWINNEPELIKKIVPM